MNADGSNLRLVHVGSDMFNTCAWSPIPAPDGRQKILFSDDDGGAAGTWDLFLINPDGTGLTNLTQTPDFSESEPTWSPSANRIAAIAAGGPLRDTQTDTPRLVANRQPHCAVGGPELRNRVGHVDRRSRQPRHSVQPDEYS